MIDSLNPQNRSDYPAVSKDVEIARKYLASNPSPVYTARPPEVNSSQNYSPRCKFCGTIVSWMQVYDPVQQKNIAIPCKPHTLENHSYSCSAASAKFRPVLLWENPAAAEDFETTLQKDIQRLNGELLAMTMQKMALQKKLESLGNGETPIDEFAKQLKGLRNQITDLQTSVSSMKNFIRAKLNNGEAPLMAPLPNGNASEHQPGHIIPKDEFTRSVMTIQQMRPAALEDISKGTSREQVVERYAGDGLTMDLLKYWLGDGPAPGTLAPKMATAAAPQAKAVGNSLSGVEAQVEALPFEATRFGSAQRMKDLIKFYIIHGNRATGKEFGCSTATIWRLVSFAKAHGMVFKGPGGAMVPAKPSPQLPSSNKSVDHEAICAKIDALNLRDQTRLSAARKKEILKNYVRVGSVQTIVLLHVSSTTIAIAKKEAAALGLTLKGADQRGHRISEQEILALIKEAGKGKKSSLDLAREFGIGVGSVNRFCNKYEIKLPTHRGGLGK